MFLVSVNLHVALTLKEKRRVDLGFRGKKKVNVKGEGRREKKAEGADKETAFLLHSESQDEDLKTGS